MEMKPASTNSRMRKIFDRGIRAARPAEDEERDPEKRLNFHRHAQQVKNESSADVVKSSIRPRARPGKQLSRSRQPPLTPAEVPDIACIPEGLCYAFDSIPVDFHVPPRRSLSFRHWQNAALITHCPPPAEPRGGSAPSSSQPEPVLHEWHDDGGEGKVTIRISLTDQIAEFKRGGRDIGWCYVATGKEGHGTSRRQLSYFRKNRG